MSQLQPIGRGDAETAENKSIVVFSAFSASLRLSVVVVTIMLLAACSREKRSVGLPDDAHRWDDNAYAISRGKTLYGSMNCVGCRANGGGAIGPPLMDDKWIYGSEPQQIFQTIVAGRPNGMPSFRMRLTDAEVWNLVAYVRTLGSLTENQARSSRDDHMKVTVNQMRRHVVEPKDTSGKRQ